MRKRALAVAVLSLVLASVAPAFAAQSAIIQEVTFDDADLNISPIKSLELRVANPGDPEQFWIMNFEGNAARTNISGPTTGRYGRGAQFDGITTSYIGITELNRPGPSNAPRDTSFRLLLWVNPTTAGGEIFRANGSFAVTLNNQGKIVIRDEDTDPHVHTTSVSIPNGAFHHLWIEYDDVNEDVTVQVDFGDRIPVPWLGPMAEWVPGTQTGTGSMGSGFSGVLDELLVTIFSEVPESDLELDRNPANCLGFSCAEDASLTMTPPGWSVEVPIRYKAVWDAATCAGQQCPLLVLISGGGACADDYSPKYEVEAYAQRRFFVVTVDPACEKGYPWLHFPHETKQLIAAKTHVMANPQFSNLIQQGGEYYAAGCSHGAQSVASWLLSEVDDHPKRGFARSANYASHCTYHMAPFVGNWNKMDKVGCGSYTTPSPHNHTIPPDPPNPQVQCIEEQLGVINLVNETTVQDRELGAIWGAPKFEYESCCTRKGCTDSLEGNELSGRLMRDYWRSKGGSATGWFWEWAPTQADACTHCPWDSDVERCSACFLRYGYVGMQDPNHSEECHGCSAQPEGGLPSDQCPDVWGLPGGGSNLPCGPVPYPDWEPPICPSPPPIHQ